MKASNLTKYVAAFLSVVTVANASADDFNGNRANGMTAVLQDTHFQRLISTSEMILEGIEFSPSMTMDMADYYKVRFVSRNGLEVKKCLLEASVDVGRGDVRFGSVACEEKPKIQKPAQQKACKNVSPIGCLD